MIGKTDYVTPKSGTIITYNGTFDLDKLYKDSKLWFKKFSYEFDERLYKEKDLPEGNEVEIRFEAARRVDEYVKFHINAHFHLLYVKKLSKDVHMGNFKVNIAAFVELDYKNKLQYNPIKKFLFFIYNNFIIKYKILNEYENKLYEEFLKFEDLIKENLGLL